MNISGRGAKSILNISVGYIKQIFILILSFATKTVFIRLLGAEYLGISGLYTNILTVLSLAELGVGNVLVYSLYKPLKEGDKATICILISYFKKIYRIIALAVAFLGVALVPFLEHIVNSNLTHKQLVIYYSLYLANSVISYLVVYKSTLIQADQKIYVNNILSMCCLVLQYVAQIVYLILTRDFLGYLVIQCICTLLANIAMNHVANRLYPYINDKVLLKSKEMSYSVLKSDIRSMLIYKASNVLVNNTDNILISILFGTVYVGYYSNYYSLVSYVATFINLTITGIMAGLGNLNLGNDSEKSYQMFRNMIYMFNVMAIFVVSCFSTVIQDFISIWIGSNYLLGFDVLFAILFTFYFNCIVNPVWMYRETMGLFKQIRFSVFMTAIINIILSIVLGKTIGLAGVIIATAIARLITTGWYEPIILYKNKFGKRVSTYFVQQAKYLFVNVMVLLFCIYVCRLLPSSLIWIVLKIVICAIIIGIIEFLFNRNTEEFVYFQNKLLRIVKLRRG